MKKLSEIISSYQKYGLTSATNADELILLVDKAIEFLNDCHNNDLAVIGIDGFEIIKGFIKPRIDIIADFSNLEVHDWESYKKRCYSSALEFLQHFKEEANIGYMFVVIGRQEYDIQKDIKF